MYDTPSWSNGKDNQPNFSENFRSIKTRIIDVIAARTTSENIGQLLPGFFQRWKSFLFNRKPAYKIKNIDKIIDKYRDAGNKLNNPVKPILEVTDSTIITKYMTNPRINNKTGYHFFIDCSIEYVIFFTTILFLFTCTLINYLIIDYMEL